MNKRHSSIIEALRQLGGRATVRQIAEKLKLHVNGVSQSLNALSADHVRDTHQGKGGERVYELR